MNLMDVLSTLRRRWYFGLLALMLATLAAAAVFSRIGPTYSAESSTVLIPPPVTVDRASSGGTYSPPNPLLYLSGLTDTRDVVVRSLASKDVAEQLQSEHPGVNFAASNDPQSSGPFIVITVDADTAQQTLDAMKAINALVPQTLKQVQDELGVKSDARITSLMLTSDQKTTVERKKQIQSTGLAWVGIFVALLLLTAFVDSLLRERDRRRRPKGRRGRGGTGRETELPPTREGVSTSDAAGARDSELVTAASLKGNES